MKWLYYLLVFIHCFLILWGIVGLAEWILPRVPWSPISNPLFPKWLLLFHWTAILAGGIAFVGGTFINWNHGKLFLTLAYLYMATLCAVETFGFMIGFTKYIALTLEYLTYSSILYMVYSNSYFSKKFQ